MRTGRVSDADQFAQDIVTTPRAGTSLLHWKVVTEQQTYSVYCRLAAAHPLAAQACSISIPGLE